MAPRSLCLCCRAPESPQLKGVEKKHKVADNKETKEKRIVATPAEKSSESPAEAAPEQTTSQEHAEKDAAPEIQPPTKSLKPWHADCSDDESEFVLNAPPHAAEFSLRFGTVTYDRGSWLAGDHGLKAGDADVEAWHILSQVRDPKNFERWITLYDHVNMRLDKGLDYCQTPMSWAEDAYKEAGASNALLDEIDQAHSHLMMLLGAVIKTASGEVKREELTFNSKYFSVHAYPMTCRVTLSLSSHV